MYRRGVQVAAGDVHAIACIIIVGVASGTQIHQNTVQFGVVCYGQFKEWKRREKTVSLPGVWIAVLKHEEPN